MYFLAAARRRKGKDRTIQESLQPRPPPKQNKGMHDIIVKIIITGSTCS